MVGISSHGWSECENCVRDLTRTSGPINTRIPQIRTFTTLAQVLKYTAKCMGLWMPFLSQYPQAERCLVSYAFFGRTVHHRLLLEWMVTGRMSLVLLLLHAH